MNALETSNKRIVVVLGMHRGGTSAITAGLEVLGVPLGDDLHPAGFDNPKGFWEDRSVIEINEGLLSLGSSSYDGLGFSIENLKGNRKVAQYKRKATELVLKKLKEHHGIWGFKDPRTSRLLPFWHQIFQDLKCDVGFIIALRNPASIAASLEKRNNIPGEKVYALWMEHMLASLNETKGSKRLLVAFEDFLENPYLQLSRIAACFGLVLPKPNSKIVNTFVRTFLDERLSHTKFTFNQLRSDKRISTSAIELYGILRGASKDEINLNTSQINSALQDIQNQFSNKLPLIKYANTLESERITLWEGISERDTRIEVLTSDIQGLHQTVTERDAQVQSLGQTISERDTMVLSLSHSVKEKESQVLTLHHAVGERDTRIEVLTSDIQGLHQTVTERDAQVQSLGQTISERDTRIEVLTSDIQGLHQTVTERDAQVQSLGQTISERDTMVLSLSHSVKEKESQVLTLHHAVGERDTRIEVLTSDIQGLHQTVTERDAQVQSLGQTISEREHEIFWLKKSLDDSRNEISAILNTNSWKITKPLRFIRRKLYDEPKVFIKNSLCTITRKVWRALPIDGSKKNYIKYSFNKLVANEHLQENITPAPSLKSENFLASNLENTGEHVSEFISLTNDPPLLVKPVKLICFYLPQFHEIEENNLWWGKGFTEWSNVKPSKSNFVGHYQPHIPGELGYYNLLDAGVQEKQVNLAKKYGIEGFCFYFYWFGGKRLLEAPVLNFLENKALDLPFCLCWANENWSRRWDGLDGEILIQQSHSPSDDIEFIKYLAKYLEDDRYIRVNGRPLILVYRPRLLPSAKETSTRWRKWCRENGIGEIYLAYTQSFENDDPEIFGFDAAIEFPPNNSSPPNVTTEIMPISRQGFSGTVYDWNIFPERSERYIEPGYTLFRSVCPGWDNTARRGHNGTIFINNSPAGFKRWLKNAIVHTVKTKKSSDERLVFVNAWNEWAEGAHLEPDQKSGYAYLQAAREAMEENMSEPGDESGKKVVLVAHDGYPHGAQFLILNIAKSIVHNFGLDVDLVCLGDGPLIAEYQKYCRVHVLSGVDARGTMAKNLAAKLYEMGHRQAIVNTTVSGKFLETLTKAGIKCISLIHELPGVIEQNKLQDCVAAITQHANKIVFPAKEVAASFGRYSALSNKKTLIRPQGLYKKRNADRTREQDRAELRTLLKIDPNSKVVLGAGYADYRKGIDLFVEAGISCAKLLESVKWVWIGHWEPSMQKKVDQLLGGNEALKDIFIFPGIQSETDIFYGGADIFALTSREDPFPSVLLEALDAKLPIVAFEKAGGFTSLLDGCGELVEYENPFAFGSAITSLLKNPNKLIEYGIFGSRLIDNKFSFRQYVFDLLDLSGIKIPRLSVIIPNYNYEKHLTERINSITSQNYPIYEIIFLDDSSKDKSVSLAKKLLNKSGIDYKIIENTKNSGSVFKQWKKGCDLASGDFIWIAEADDFCEKNFLKSVMPPFYFDDVNISYCQSRQVDERGDVLADTYLEYVSDIDATYWKKDYIRDGIDEIKNYLCIKNTIPNVSAVIFRANKIKDVLNKEIQNIISYKIAGDWYVYVEMLASGRIAFKANALNSHRRHSEGVTISNSNKNIIIEILKMQKNIEEKFIIESEKRELANNYILQLEKILNC